MRGRVLYRGGLLVWQAAPAELRRLAFFNTTSGAGPVALLWLGKVVIDRVALLIGEQPADGALPGAILSSPVILWSVVGSVAINVLLDSVETLESFEVASLRDRVQGRAKALVYEKVASFEDIALFEDPEAVTRCVKWHLISYASCHPKMRGRCWYAAAIRRSAGRIPCLELGSGDRFRQLSARSSGGGGRSTRCAERA